MKLGICSGYYNPIHLGHIEYLNAAKKECDYLIAIINSDEQVKRKGSVPFMEEQHRKEIVLNLKSVGGVIISTSKDKTVCSDIRTLYSIFGFKYDLIFFNSGDRKGQNLESEEMKVCKELNIKYQILDLPKIYSSSELIKNAISHCKSTHGN